MSTVELHIDEIHGMSIRGWAVDRARQDTPVLLHLIVDGQELGVVHCIDSRLDVLAAGVGPEACGFQITFPDALLDREHRLEFRDVKRQAARAHYRGEVRDHVECTPTFVPKLVSHVDGVANGAIRGWALRSHRGRDGLEGGAMLQVSCDGVTVGHIRANRHRPDVGKSLSAPGGCGFNFTLPRGLRSGQHQTFRFHLLPEHLELDGSPITCRLVTDAEEARFIALADRVDGLHRELTQLRREIRELVPRPDYTVDDYDGWFRAYLPHLRRRVERERLSAVDQPMVSVLCPIYRPKLAEFRQAVESVLAQTYRNWELVLVDDGSRDKDLAACLAEYARQDARVRVLSRKKNGGISAATTDALNAARGEWVAFFDHDDLLVDVALDCMLAHAVRTGAKVLYSDEDKLNEQGAFSEPAFKPDWNARMMLSANYVCHLLLVRKDVTDVVGGFETKYNGAQDHDYILRLSEHVSPGDICHVPEVLYHWRITAGSTASDIGAKPYAVKAGIACITDHLARKGRPATVESVQGLSVYKVDWGFDASPRVTVIIPYREQIETTGRCLSTLLDNTDYPAFDVLLVDNWSASKQAAAFAKRAVRDKRVRVMRVEEGFNYSRLNNLAVAEASAEFLMFMNNDLFVSRPDWLRVLVNEMLADPEVGVVGGLFFYPNGTIQHAGVVLGAEGVAGHAHVGLRRDDPGYAGRRLFAQEMSAVTAAGMLVRAEAFRQVGGFDEKNLTVAFNDVDLCLRLREEGWKVVWTPEFEAEHHESLSRGDDLRPAQESRFFDEVQYMRERWCKVLDNDPYYNPNFSLDTPSFSHLTSPLGEFSRIA